MENILANNGFTTALAGIAIVFAGLVLIAVVIVVFNFIMQPSKGKVKTKKLVVPEQLAVKKEDLKPIPEDHLVAIATAIELYRKLHFDVLQNEITFVRGEDAANAWKMGHKFGQREM